MATYKKGFKKQSSEQVLLKVILGVIVSVLILVAIVFIYDVSSKWKNYSNYTEITEYANIIDFTNGEEEPLEDYIVYFYSTNCEYCAEVKEDVLKLGTKINRGTDEFFIVNTAEVTDAAEEYEDFVSELDAVYDELLTNILTPSIAIFVDGELYDYIIGSDVLDALESIQEGTYEPFND